MGVDSAQLEIQRGCLYEQENRNPSKAYLSFWWLTISMIFIVLTITGAGMVQTYMERLMGLDYVAVKTTCNLWFWILRAIFGFGFGFGFLIGVGSLSRTTSRWGRSRCLL